ncbi:MAG TPA: hemerythrin domain-containing protein [Patescibacteria group bacterium]|nr:hemerythrin domain-containing protein [Patescibacteria group bacterium]
MNIGTRVDYFRKEHHHFLRFLDDWENALELTGSQDEQERLRGVNRLRGLQPQLQALRDHCTSEERNVEGPYHGHLEKGQIDALRTEHEQLARLLGDLFSELRFATLHEAERARMVGRHVAAFARRHILFEEELLAEIERKLSQEAEENLLLRYTQAPD